MIPTITASQLADLQKFDTCTVANSIETFDVRLRNEGFTNQSVRRFTSAPTPMVGHAVTLRIRCSSPPMRGHNYVDRTDWWNYILTIPAPRVVVIQDVDERPGTGTFLGEVHANILLALGCVGGVTNGVVRDVPAVEKTGFQLFAGGVAVSHAYSHIVDFGKPVQIGGLAVGSGDLLHADLHGVLSVPMDIAAQIPAVAAQAVERERKLISLCRGEDFSLEKLRSAVKGFFN